MKKFKYMIVGAIVGATLATAGSSFAATAFETLKATVRPDYKIVVDGKDATLNNKPVTIDGSTYLPVREVASLFDKDVNFKSSTNTITLTSKGDENVATTINLDDYASLSSLMGVSDLTITLGPDEHSNNTLTLTKGNNAIKILNLVPPKNADQGTYELSNGGKIEVYFYQSSTYLEKSALIALGIF